MSVNVIPVIVLPPLFLTVMVYTIISPAPVVLFPLSVTAAVFVTSSDADAVIEVTVPSSVVLPSPSSPSSLISVTSFVLPGLDAVTKTVLETLPVSTAACAIV